MKVDLDGIFGVRQPAVVHAEGHCGKLWVEQVLLVMPQTYK